MTELKIDNLKNLWITSDTHYNHGNICKGVSNWADTSRCRVFDTVVDMNEAIVDGINSVVGENDVLIHLGDVAFNGWESIIEFRSLIRCKEIHLILGNHDNNIVKKPQLKQLFTTIENYRDLKFEGHRFILCHYPILSWNDLYKGTFHLHGHLHSYSVNKFGKGRKMDVGIDGHDEFRPYNLKNEIIPLLINRPKISDLDVDHHNEIKQ